VAATAPLPSLSVPDVAEALGVSTKTVRRYIAAGLLTAYRVGPKLLRLNADEVDRIARRIPTAGAE
jgi:excisionase family DNA binding protein